MRLFTIGDSVSQGFMSLAAARTDLCYSTLIAKVLGLRLGKTAYRIPNWPKGGHPVNLEQIFREIQRHRGSEVSWWEWPLATNIIRQELDRSEQYYENGSGGIDVPDPEGVAWYHNVSFYGMNVAESWLLTPEICRDAIEEPEDDTFGVASQSFERSALRMLNPSRSPEHDQRSAIGWLEYHAASEGVENLLLWLGSNNVLGTILRLNVCQTPGLQGKRPHELSYSERKSPKCGGATWNLWHPDDFHAEYEELIRRVDAALDEGKQHVAQPRVFCGTIPHVTIAPLAKGVGSSTVVPKTRHNGDTRELHYFKYYTYFPFEEQDISDVPFLTLNSVVQIDDSIDEFNRSIRGLTEDANQRLGYTRYHIVDINDALEQLAFKRNGGAPTYELPRVVHMKHPRVNSKMYHADPRTKQITQGGLFSLDGVHPSAIGQGLIAHEFLKVMAQAGVVDKAGRTISPESLQWENIFRDDTLYDKPVTTFAEIRDNEALIRRVMDWFDWLR